MPETQQIPAGHTPWACSTCRTPASATWIFCERCGTDFRTVRPTRLAMPVPLQATVVEPVPPSVTELLPAPRTVQPAIYPPARDSFLDQARDRLPSLPHRPGISVGTRTVAAVIGGVLAVALIGVGLVAHLNTRSELHRTERQLASAQEQLTDANADLVSVRTGLASTQGELETKNDRLDEAQGSLDDANQKLNLQSDQIGELTTCLGGVNSAFGYILDEDYTSALSQLNGVESACDAAYALF